MDFRNLPLIGTKFFFFLLQLAIIFACVTYIEVVYVNTILPDKHVKESFTESTCTLLSKELAQRGHLVHSYRANFLLSYLVNGTAYQSWATGNGLDQAYFHERGPQEDTLAQFTVGESYPCWYNSEHPQSAVLVLRHNWASTLPLAIPTIIALISIYYLLKMTFQFFGFLAVKADEKKKRFKR